MANLKTYNRSFAGGEISPEMYGRIDDQKYHTGAAKLRNFIATPQGPAENRPGFAFVRSTKNNGVARLIPFTYSTDQTMVVEMGAGYFRFHSQGETLVYNPAVTTDWTAPSGDITLSCSSPSVVTWTDHGLEDGDEVVFYLYGSTTLEDVPTPLQVGYPYTVKKIDADTFQILDGDTPVGLQPGAGTPGTPTTYTGTGTASVTSSCGPYGTDTDTSSVLNGLSSAAVLSGVATLSVDISSSVVIRGVASAQAEYQYTTDGTKWMPFYTTRGTETRTLSVPIPIQDAAQLQLRVVTSCEAAGGTVRTLPGYPYYRYEPIDDPTLPSAGSASITADITAWSLTVSVGGTISYSFSGVRAYRRYEAGETVSYSGDTYAAMVTGNGGMVTPGSDDTVWHLLPAQSVYEIPNNYAEADLFDIHYVQSADVLTLVHKNYPPSELKRLGATNWSFSTISFLPSVDVPSGVTVTPTPGFSLPISHIDLTNPAVITAGGTRNQPFSLKGVFPRIFGSSSKNGSNPYQEDNNTLTVGDGVYMKDVWVGNGTPTKQLDGFYMISTIPEDSDGNPILNKMELMDYSGNILDLSSYTSAHHDNGTLQYGSKVYDINQYYVVTAVSVDGSEESKVSEEVTALNNLYVSGAYNTISWDNLATIDIYGLEASPTTDICTITLAAGTTARLSVGQKLTYSVPNVDLAGVGSVILSILNDHQVTVAYSGIRTWAVVTVGDPMIIGTTNAGNVGRYRIYKKRNGLYGYIGETTTGRFVDNNIAPDMGITPPNYDVAFDGVGNYPGAVSYYQQRRVFGGTTNKPLNFVMTKSGTESNLSYSLPTTDSDRISVRIAAREANTILHIVPLTQLLMLTGSAEIRVSPVNSDVITPTSIDARPQSYVGSSTVQPVVVNNALVYCCARGGHVRELGYNWQANGFITGDLSLRAAHLFDNLSIVDECFTKAPRPIVWFVSSNGKLLGLTYIPEEQIGAWHWHDTDGVFESVTAVAEGDEDRLYAVIRRTINGSTVRYIERMASRQITTLSECFFVDAGVTYRPETPTSTVSGLSWLEGKTVAVLADGAVCPSQTVNSGSITLPHPASVIHVGLPITSDLETLPLTMQIDGFGQGSNKNINKAWLKVWKSSSVLVGPDANNLKEAKQRTTEPYGSPPALVSDSIEVMLTPSWQESGKVFIRQSNPLPLTVSGLTLQVAIGG